MTHLYGEVVKVVGQLIFCALDDPIHLLEGGLEHAGGLGGEGGPLLPLGLTHPGALGWLCNIALDLAPSMFCHNSGKDHFRSGVLRRSHFGKIDTFYGKTYVFEVKLRIHWNEDGL